MLLFVCEGLSKQYLYSHLPPDKMVCDLILFVFSKKPSSEKEVDCLPFLCSHLFVYFTGVPQSLLPHFPTGITSRTNCKGGVG